MQLATRAEQEFGDYHTFLRKTFLNRFHATYRGHQSEAGDRNWLCRLSLVLALAESNTTTRQPIQLNLDGEAIETSPDDNHASSTEPNKSLSAGVELFEQGLALLKVAYETPTVDDVEALNLAVSRRLIAPSWTELIILVIVVTLLLHSQPPEVGICVRRSEHTTRPLFGPRPPSTSVLVQP